MRRLMILFLSTLVLTIIFWTANGVSNTYAAEPPPGGCKAQGVACTSTGECCSGLACSPNVGVCITLVTTTPPPIVSSQSGPSIEGCGIQTAIGCIPIQDEQELAVFFLRWGMGLGGGVALIMIVISTFMIMTSEGDPRKLQAGKELLTSAIAGLVLLVFSAWILNFIGVTILDIF